MPIIPRPEAATEKFTFDNDTVESYGQDAIYSDIHTKRQDRLAELIMGGSDVKAIIAAVDQLIDEVDTSLPILTLINKPSTVAAFWELSKAVSIRNFYLENAKEFYDRFRELTPVQLGQVATKFFALDTGSLYNKPLPYAIEIWLNFDEAYMLLRHVGQLVKDGILPSKQKS